MVLQSEPASLIGVGCMALNHLTQVDIKLSKSLLLSHHGKAVSDDNDFCFTKSPAASECLLICKKNVNFQKKKAFCMCSVSCVFLNSRTEVVIVANCVFPCHHISFHIIAEVGRISRSAERHKHV